MQCSHTAPGMGVSDWVGGVRHGGAHLVIGRVGRGRPAPEKKVVAVVVRVERAGPGGSRAVPRARNGKGSSAALAGGRGGKEGHWRRQIDDGHRRGRRRGKREIESAWISAGLVGRRWRTMAASGGRKRGCRPFYRLPMVVLAGDIFG